ncbi:MAG: anti-sigma factor [Kouleothrix sp.]|nr:anti-sigma factor [Kouleothrix sp.]
MNDHPQDSIPAFVLGALDADEAILVSRHLAACPACRAEAAAFHAAVAELPYAAAPHTPPPHVKRQLFARIAATAPGEHAAALPGLPARPRSRWMGVVAAGSLALALAFGAMMVDARSRVATLTARIEQAERRVAQMSGQLTQGPDAAIFIAAPQTVGRRLASPDQRASAMMYMQPDNPHAVLIVQGLQPAAPGTTYQFWLARPGEQVPSSTFDVTQAGTAMVMIDAPAPVSQYDQVMVTVERAGGSRLPSDQVLLSGLLGSLQHALARR